MDARWFTALLSPSNETGISNDLQILQEKFDKLELQHDSKAKESESYKSDLEKVISELAQIKETLATNKEAKEQFAKEVDRLKGEVKVKLGQGQDWIN